MCGSLLWRLQAERAPKRVRLRGRARLLRLVQKTFAFGIRQQVRLGVLSYALHETLLRDTAGLKRRGCWFMAPNPASDAGLTGSRNLHWSYESFRRGHLLVIFLKSFWRAPSRVWGRRDGGERYRATVGNAQPSSATTAPYRRTRQAR